MKQNQTKKIIIAIVALVVVGAVFFAAYMNLKPTTQKGAKEIKVTVIDKEGKETEYTVHTDAEYLLGVLEDAKEEGLTYSGEEGDYGLMIDTVNDEKASFEDGGAYWGFSVNGEYCNYGVSEQPAADGDEFEVKYTISE